MVDSLVGFTEVASVQNAKILAMVQSYLQQSSKMLPLVMDYSSMVKKGDKSIALPTLAGFTVNDKVENTAVSAQTITFGADTLDLNKHKVIQWLIEKSASIQSVADVEAEYMLRAVADLARQVDKDIIAQLKLASSTTPDHRIVFIDTATDVIARGDILEARRLLEVQHLPVNELYLAISSEKEKEMLNIADFIDASKFGSNEPIFNGQIGKVYGIPVILHEDCEDFMVMWHKTAVGYASQLGPDFATQGDLGNLGTRYSIDHMYGVKVLDSGKRNVFVDSTNA